MVAQVYENQSPIIFDIVFEYKFNVRRRRKFSSTETNQPTVPHTSLEKHLHGSSNRGLSSPGWVSSRDGGDRCGWTQASCSQPVPLPQPVENARVQGAGQLYSLNPKNWEKFWLKIAKTLYSNKFLCIVIVVVPTVDVS